MTHEFIRLVDDLARIKAPAHVQDTKVMAGSRMPTQEL